MRCRNLTAYLNREFGPTQHILMRIHISACPNCRKTVDEEADLSREIRRLEDIPVPQTLREKLLSDAVVAADSVHTQPTTSQQSSRLQGVLMMKKGLIALGLMAAIVVIGLGVLPQQRESIALADVARAMANVKSVHLTGWGEFHGGRHEIECWLEGRTRYVLIYDGEVQSADDGKVWTGLRYVGDQPYITIKPSGSEPLAAGVDLMSLLQGDEDALDAWVRNVDAQITERRVVKAVDGRQLIVLVIAGESSKSLITIDADTCLVVGWSEQDNTGHTVIAMDHIEYDVAVDDSVFEMQVPEGAIVEDH